MAHAPVSMEMQTSTVERNHLHLLDWPPLRSLTMPIWTECGSGEVLVGVEMGGTTLEYDLEFFSIAEHAHKP